MSKRIALLTLLVMSPLALNGCANMNGQQNRSANQQANASCPFWSEKMVQGVIAGGIAGGAVASTSGHRSTSDILTGIFAGGLLGGAIGKTLDKKDCGAAQSAMQQMATAHAGTVVTWRNPDSGNSGTFVAKGMAQQNETGQLCRPYHQTVLMSDGTAGAKDGTTCRDANGDWFPVS